MNKPKLIKTEELASIVCKAIEDEPYFSKDILIPKIKALMTHFRIQVASVNYNSIEKPSDKARLIRANEIMNRERTFYKNHLRDLIGEDKMKKIFEELEEKRKYWEAGE